MLAALKQIDFSYEDKLILKDISLCIEENSRIGLIGINGAGKTTLLNVILKNFIPNVGEVYFKSGLTYGYLKQNSGLTSDNTVYNEMKLVFDDVLQAENKLRILEKEIAGLDHKSREFILKEKEYVNLTAFYEAKDGYNIDVKIKTILNGMGFIGFYGNIISTMSGGEKTRLELAKLLLTEPELLVLDEPTNHLDFETLMWLEEYLGSYKGAIIIVSHDRYFLDKTVSRIWELNFGSLLQFKGNYSKYKILSEQQLLSGQREYEKQQIKIASMQDYIAKNTVRASTAKSAKSRVHQLENIEIIEKPKIDTGKPVFNFGYDIEPVKTVLNVKGLNLFAGGKQLLKDAAFSVQRGEKFAIVGANGTGKSTLIKHLLNNHLKFDYNIVWGGNVTLSYYDQENLNLNFNNSVIDEIWGTFRSFTQTEIRKMLAGMQLYEEDITKTVGQLSGGQRAKLGFAMMTAKRANTLMLDEPTNHLDLRAREELEKALKNFTGTIIFVSHDRYFLSSVADRILEIDGNKLNYYKCGFEEYILHKKQAAQLKSKTQNIVITKVKETNFRSSKQRSGELAVKNSIAEKEKAISKNEEREKEIYIEMGKTFDYELLFSLSKELENLKSESEKLYGELENLIN